VLLCWKTVNVAIVWAEWHPARRLATAGGRLKTGPRLKKLPHKILLLFLLIARCVAQTPALIEGDFGFLQMSLSQASGLSVETLRGAASFQSRAFKIRGERGVDRNAGSSFTADGAYENDAPGQIAITNPRDVTGRLSARIGTGKLLLATSTDASRHELFLAARPSGSLLAGEYRGAYFRVQSGKPGALTTALLRMKVESTKLQSATAIGHLSDFDDVNRPYNLTGARFVSASGNNVEIDFGKEAEILSGRKRLWVADGGRLLLGASVDVGAKEIFLLAHMMTGTAQLRGTFWLAGLGAQIPFVAGGAPELYHGLGSLRADGAGNAVITERFQIAGKAAEIITKNRMHFGTDGMFSLSAELSTRLNNLAVTDAPSLFVGAHVGLEGELTLDHGIFAGMQAEDPR